MCHRGCKLHPEHLFTSKQHSRSSLGLRLCIVHLHIYPGRRDSLCQTFVPPPSRHYPFHTRLSPSPCTWSKVSPGKLARKLACPWFRKMASFGKIRLFRIPLSGDHTCERTKKPMTHTRRLMNLPEGEGKEGEGGVWRSTTR